MCKLTLHYINGITFSSIGILDLNQQVDHCIKSSLYLLDGVVILIIASTSLSHSLAHQGVHYKCHILWTVYNLCQFNSLQKG